jgi:hypothetical protein
MPLTAALTPLMRSCPGVLAINWLFQGMRGMDGRELRFRLLFETLLLLLIALPVMRLATLPPALATTLALMSAHSLNFLINGQFWVCVRYCPHYRNDEQRLNDYLSSLTTRLEGLDWLDEAVIIGSAAHGRVRCDRSDIDLRILIPQGPVGWLRANLLLINLRMIALLRMMPLDVYGYDGPDSLRRFRQNEPVRVISNRRGRLDRVLAGRTVLQ